LRVLLAAGRDDDSAAAFRTNTTAKRKPKSVRVIPASSGVVTET